MEIVVDSIKLNSLNIPINMNLSSPNVIGLCGDDSKYQFARLLAGLFKPFSGNILVNNISTNHKHPEIYRKNIAYLYQNQNDSFYKEYVKDELYYGMKYYKLNWYELDKKTKEVLEYFNLGENLLERKISELSNTEQKKIMWASTCFYNPKIIIMEDYELGFRDKERIDIKRKIKELAREKDKLIIVISNDLKYLYDIVDYIYVFDKGNVVLKGDKYLMFENSISKYVEIPEILSFIKHAEEKGVYLTPTMQINDLIKEIYRSVKY